MQLAELNNLDVAALSPDTPVVLPIAAVEQHGPHLPMATDTYLLTEIVNQVDKRLGASVLFAPVLWLGNSHHHLDFPGTLSVAPDRYPGVLVELLENLIAHRFHRILLLNGHGGNDVPARQALYEVRQRYRSRSDLLLLMATYWSLADQTLLEHPPELHQKTMGHACEWETSMMLLVAPHLVGDYQDLPEVEFGVGFKPASRAWVTAERSPQGYLGAPAAASQQKGERLLAAFTRGVEQLLSRMADWDGTSWDG